MLNSEMNCDKAGLRLPPLLISFAALPCKK